MKKQLLIAAGLFMLSNTSILAQQDPILMEVNGKKITKSEFLQVYLKNNSDPKFDQATLDEYMELYKKFQLKVTAAEDLGYDTIPKLKRELEGYQKQLAQPYLTDTEMNHNLVKQAYERMKKEIRAAHILVKLDATALPEDTLKAYNKALKIRERILKGEDFETLAKGKDGSDDPSVKNNGGDLGFFTAFQMVYPFEEAAYNMKIGDISMPIRTRFGYHILKLTDVRDARGTMKAAHLMIAANKETDQQEVIDKARSKANEIYDRLVAGESYDNLVKAYSDDPSSAANGGLLPVFGTGASTRMIPEFEEAAFSLNKDGDFSKPVQSSFGFHIIRRIELTPLKSFEDLKKEIESKVNRDERANKTQNSYVDKLKNEYNYQDLSAKSIKWFDKNIDSTIFKSEFNTKKKGTEQVLFNLNGKAYTIADYSNYLNDNPRLTRGIALNEVATKNFKDWVNQEVLELEKSRLTVKYPEYKALMNEYHDGILLYEIMSDKVWNKAMKDTTGLKNFYEANKSKYMWDNRYDIVAFESVSPAVAKKAYKLAGKKISADSVAKILNHDSELNVRVRQGKFEISKTPYLQNVTLKVGKNKPYSVDGKNYVVILKENIPAKNKEINEAKGIITSDYQTYLENEWMNELTKKYPVTIHKDILYSIGK